MKLNNFLGDLTDISAKKEALVGITVYLFENLSFVVLAMILCYYLISVL